MTSQRPVAVITGTSSGIGRALAEHFLAHGYAVAGCSRRASALQSEHYTHRQLDVTNEDEVRRWARCISTELGRVDLLICNAALGAPAEPLGIIDGRVLEALLRTNISGTFYACREFSKLMMRQKSGRIVTFSSVAAGLHEEGTTGYASSKAAVVELTKVMARELAPYGITCNVVAPSYVGTAMSQHLGPEVRERLLQKLTIQRELTVAEIAGVVSFLAGESASAITGQVIYMGLVV